MRWFPALMAALMALLLCGNFCQADEDIYLRGVAVRRVIIRPGWPARRVIRPVPVPAVPVPVPAVPVPVPVPVVPKVRIVPVPVQSCPDCPQPRSAGGQSFPDRLDGGELPDDLFGGIPDPRNGGSPGGAGSGHTAFIIR